MGGGEELLVDRRVFFLFILHLPPSLSNSLSLSPSRSIFSPGFITWFFSIQQFGSNRCIKRGHASTSLADQQQQQQHQFVHSKGQSKKKQTNNKTQAMGSSKCAIIKLSLSLSLSFDLIVVVVIANQVRAIV